MLPWFKKGSFPLYLAPMAGFTDLGFRQLCKDRGADVLVSEFVMAEAVLRENPRTWETIDFSESQRPMGVQIFGSEPERMALAAQKIVERLQPDFLDLNFGCPSEKVTCQMAGASVLKDLSLLGRIAGAVRKALPVTPVTAKIRLGWDETSIVAEEAGRILEEEGMEALTIHGRTRTQGYQGDADMDRICEVASRLSIPVVANGSVEAPGRVEMLAHQSPCRGAMVGRAALGYPWIFRELKAKINGLPAPPFPTPEERWEILFAYADQLLQGPGGHRQGRQLGWMRSKLNALTRKVPGGKQIRLAISQSPDLDALMKKCEEAGIRAQW